MDAVEGHAVSEQDLRIETFEQGIPTVNYYCTVSVTHVPSGRSVSVSGNNRRYCQEMAMDELLRHVP